MRRSCPTAPNDSLVMVYGWISVVLVSGFVSPFFDPDLAELHHEGALALDAVDLKPDETLGVGGVDVADRRMHAEQGTSDIKKHGFIIFQHGKDSPQEYNPKAPSLKEH